MPSATNERAKLINAAEKDLARLETFEAERREIAAPFDVQIAELVSERDNATSDLDVEIDEVKDSLKAHVLDLKESVKGFFQHAVYSKGRTIWDSEMLEGYAIEHPKVLAMRKVGRPSVSIRKVK